MPTSTKSEADVTAMRNRGSGAITDPNQAVNPPANAPKTNSEADANPDQDGLKAADRLYANDRLEADYDFEVAQDVDPREGRQPGDAAEQDQGQEAEGAIDRMLRIKYRGKEEDVPEADAITMVQQFKMMDNKYGPILEMARDLSEKTGETDPEKIAQMLASSMQRASQDPALLGTPYPEAPAPEVMAEAPPQMLQQRDPQALAQAQTKAQAFFDDNGLTPTEDALDSMKNMIMYGNELSTVASMLPKMMADIEGFKQEQQSNAAASKRTLVDTTAEATASELGIDTEQEFNDYVSWVDEQEKFIPGYKEIISGNPQAMDKSIRDYHAISMGNKNTQENAAMKASVEKTIKRAGGETVASRGSDSPGGPPPTNFNDDIMNMI